VCAREGKQQKEIFSQHVHDDADAPQVTLLAVLVAINHLRCWKGKSECQ